jgi:putative membrane protein
MGLRSKNAFLLKQEFKVRLLIIIFYTTGVAGFAIPATRELFLKLTPLALVLSMAVILFFHNQAYDKKTIIFFAAVVAGTWAIETIGVHTGAIFGTYSYGPGLGIKLYGVPLLIGINWLFLTYCTSAIAGHLPFNPLIKVVLSSLMMVIYDLILEVVAPFLSMWNFDGGMPPFRNYAAWFTLSLLIHILLKISGIKTENRLAPLIIMAQAVFFILLIIIFKFTE